MRQRSNHRSLRQRVAWLLPLGLAAGCHKAGGPGAEGAGAERNARPAAVETDVVLQGDVPVTFSGLGLAAANFTATVKSRVDGRIDSVLFVEGQQVKRGQALLQVDPRPFAIALQAAEASLARDEATLKNTQHNVARNSQLLQKNLVAEQTVSDLQAGVDALLATVLADKAAVAAARLNLQWSRITAPIDGCTGMRLVDPGNLVHASDANGLVVITQLDPIAVLFTLPEDNLPEVAQQMRAGPLTVAATSRDGKVDLGRGRLLLIDNQINTATGTMRLKAVFDNPNTTLWPNQFVRVELHVKTLHDALHVPAAALQHGPHGDFVYRVDAQSVAHVTPVEVLGIQGERAILKRGLSQNDVIIVDGQYKLHEGAQVQASRSGPSAAEAAPR